MHSHHFFRNLAVIVLLAVAGVIALFSVASRDSVELAGNIVSVNNIFVQENVSTAVAKKDTDYLEREFGTFENWQDFAADLEKCALIEDIFLESLSTGFWLSFECAKAGSDVLHPYFGYFENTSGKIFWSVSPQGKIIFTEIRGGQKLVAIENTSAFPWSAKNHWQNSAGNEIMVNPDQSRVEIKRGEKITFVTKAEDEVLFFENTKHGFYLELR